MLGEEEGSIPPSSSFVLYTEKRTNKLCPGVLASHILNLLFEFIDEEVESQIGQKTYPKILE